MKKNQIHKTEFINLILEQSIKMVLSRIVSKLRIQSFMFDLKLILFFCFVFLIVPRYDKSDTKQNQNRKKKSNVPSIQLDYDYTYYETEVKDNSSNIDSRTQNLSNDNINDTVSAEIGSFNWKSIFETELIDLNSGEKDKSEKFRITKNVIVGEKFKELSQEYDVSLVSFASLDKLYWIPVVLR